MRRPPAFWDRDPLRPGLLPRLLAPVAALYAGETARRVARPGARLDRPVVCIGNLNAGGTGKTPAAIALLEHLTAQGAHPHVVLRGYGGMAHGVVRVDPARHGADHVGDEALLLSAFAPAWVSTDRVAGGRAAVAAGADVVVLDDGFQNPSVVKDLSIVVVDAAAGFGNGRVIPAGPLREPVAAGLARADFLLAVGTPSRRDAFHRRWGAVIPVPRIAGELVPLQTGMDWRGLRTLAFAGIGRPEKFFETLAGVGADVVHAEPLGDHQPLAPALMRRLELDAARLGAQLVTTEKDAVRLPASFRPKVLTLPVRLRLEEAAPLTEALRRLGL